MLRAVSIKPRILIADDDPDTRAIVSSILSLLECDIVEAQDGLEAMAICEKGLPDLAVLDVMMPGHQGTEVCSFIKSQASGPLVPVIMLTARDTVQDKVDAFDIGADDYLTKPFNYQELQARIKALLRVRSLNVKLHEANLELLAAQEKIVQQERQLVVMQLAGTAAHELGQPLSAILLNCHLLQSLPREDEKVSGVINAIKSDAKRMAEIIERLEKVDAGKTRNYFDSTDILKMPGAKK